MITARGWWLLVVIFSFLALGVLGGRLALSLLALTLLLWFLGEWLLFALRLHLAVPALKLRRLIRDERGTVDTLWAGRTFYVRVELRLAHWLGIPFVKVTDFLPFGARPGKERLHRQGSLSPENSLALEYSIRCPVAGEIRFEGVGIQLADFQGLFYHSTFVPGVVLYRVLPPLADAEGHRPTVKRNNLLPSPGMHRHLRPGTGSELLELRDYLPGDPPKTIAWKVSARRDRLITKEFESEVPLRCTLFVDTSQSVRVRSSGQTALSRLVELSAAVAQAAAGARDLTGLCLFDDKAVTRVVRPARGNRHLIQMFHWLAEAAVLAPATGQARLSALLPLAYALAQEVYPYLLRPQINRVPFWLPLFWPLPTYSGERPSWQRRLFRSFIFAVAFAPLLLTTALVAFLSDLLIEIVPPIVPLSETMLTVVGCALLVGLVVIWYPIVNLAANALPLLFSPRRRRLARWRKQLAALLSERYGLAPGGLARFLEDDQQFVLYLQRFLAEHQVPYPLPLFDPQGRYLFASPNKVKVLAAALLRAVGKGRDNELFVLLVDLLELPEHLEPLLKAIRVTLARHHQVMLICPWPPGIVPPGSEKSKAAKGWALVKADPRLAVHQATTDRLHQAFAKLRQTFARLGVPIVCAASGDPVRLILDRLDRLRSLGLGRKR
jgi:uncharacterized protein (DUF58 family)